MTAFRALNLSCACRHFRIRTISLRFLSTRSRYAGAIPVRIAKENEQADSDVILEEEETTLSWKRLPKFYLQLSKFRLTGLVVTTAMAGYAIAPGPLELSTLAWLSLGTGLCSASANAINQYLEIPYDSKMSRTKNRVLVRKFITPMHAIGFASLAGTAGALLLATQVNTLTALLGAANIALYTGAYTPLKRITILNTWIGAIVGSVPPLMGYTANLGELSLSSLPLFGLLFSWQMVHFNALSWNLKGDYTRGGYKMMAVSDPGLCRRVALRHCLALFPICVGAPLLDVTTWWFVVDSIPVNAWFGLLAWRFYRKADNRSARRLFQFSLLHLPLIMALMLINKKEWSQKEKHEEEDIVVSENGMFHL
eukprot:m.182113 g.182113  ORF g.182113 m.182113 type:complete len:367 (+) comp39285_c0_seq28:51-1151(+)